MSEGWMIGVVISLVICSTIGAVYFINEISYLTEWIKRNENYTQQELDRLDLELQYQKGSIRRYVIDYEYYTNSIPYSTIVYSHGLTDALRQTKGHVKFITEQFKLEGKTYSNTYDEQLRLIEEPNAKEEEINCTIPVDCGAGKNMFCSGF